MRLTSLFLLVATCALFGCDDPSTTSVPDGTTDGGSGKTGLAIVSLGKESVYWGQTTWVVLNEPRSSIAGLKLFVATNEMTIDSCVDKKLYFRSGQNAESGTLRLYDSTTQAKGDQRIHFIPHDVFFKTEIYYASITSGYPYQSFWIPVTDLPLRREEWDVYINDVKLEAELREGKNIYTKISPLAVSGKLRVRSMDRMVEVTPFTVLKHEKPFLAGDPIRSAFMQVYEMEADELFTSKTDTLHEPTFSMAISVDLLPEGVGAVLAGDSTRLRAAGIADGSYVDLTIKEDAQGSLSGTLRMRESDLDYETEQNLEVHFQNMAWTENDGKYLINAFGPSLDDHLLDISGSFSSPSQNRKLLKYLGTSQKSTFYIMLQK